LKLASLDSRHELLAVSRKLGEEKSEAALRNRFGKDWRGADEGAADNSLGWRYKFGPLPNNGCVLQDVAEWSRNQPAMNSSQADRR
jgi:hypothetical protein